MAVCALTIWHRKDRAKYEFRPSFDDWGRFVVELRAATDDELMHLQSRYLMFRLRDSSEFSKAVLPLFGESVRLYAEFRPPGVTDGGFRLV